MKILFTSLLLLSSGLSYAQTNLNPKAFSQKLKSTKNAQLLDVRTPQEWSEGKIKNSVCINFMAADFKTQIERLDKTKPVFVFCAAGGRSTKAAKELKQAGFVEIYNLYGGGYPDLK